MQGEDDSVHSDQKKSPNSLFISCESLSNMFVNCETCSCQILATGSPKNKGIQRGCWASNRWNVQQILQRALSEEQTTRFRRVGPWWLKSKHHFEIVLIQAHFSYLCYCFYSPWQNLWVAGSSCRGSPQRDGQQLWQTLQSLSRRAERTGVLTDEMAMTWKKTKRISWSFVRAVPSVEPWWTNAASWKQLVKCVFIQLWFCVFCFRWHLQRRNPNFLS